MNKRAIITLGIIGFLLTPLKWALHVTHEVADEISTRALLLELKLKQEAGR